MSVCLCWTYICSFLSVRECVYVDALAPVIIYVCRRALLCLSCILEQLSLLYEDAFESTPQDLHVLQVVVVVVMISPHPINKLY